MNSIYDSFDLSDLLNNKRLFLTIYRIYLEDYVSMNYLSKLNKQKYFFQRTNFVMKNSLFDNMLNNSQIAIEGYNIMEGNLILIFLRAIIDDDFTFIYDIMINDMKQDKIIIDDTDIDTESDINLNEENIDNDITLDTSYNKLKNHNNISILNFFDILENNNCYGLIDDTEMLFPNMMLIDIVDTKDGEYEFDEQYIFTIERILELTYNELLVLKENNIIDLFDQLFNNT
jgi:hypothetical protein